MYKNVVTPCGEVRGIIEGDIVKFKGIRYATSKRWAYPTLVRNWDGVLDAFDYRECCYQNRAINDESLNPTFYYKEYREGINYTYSEDCLFLNIFTPKAAKENDKLPVIVYIHGGSFRSCSANEKCFMDPVWPKKGVIGVTINYRLGLLGFGCFKDAEEESGHTGNYGLADQITALEWIKENIESFGGDKNNVTIMGQSAGAMSVQALCFSPMSENLFHKAVMISGGGIHKLMTLRPSSSKMSLFEKLYEATGCKNFEELRNYDVVELHKKYYELCKTTKGMGMIGIPYIDGKYLVDSQYNMLNNLRNIPYLIGTTSEDIMPYILFRMSKQWCLLQDKNNFVPSYLWMFERRLPGDNSGAFHCADMWYWFGTLDNSWRKFTKEDYILSDIMISYLCNFSKNGNPNDINLPYWKEISKNQKHPLHFNVDKVEMKKVNELTLFLKMFSRPVGF
jgi:para-nitrobenzyl esterase